jgi:hypothetical protein
MSVLGRQIHSLQSPMLASDWSGLSGYTRRTAASSPARNPSYRFCSALRDLLFVMIRMVSLCRVETTSYSFLAQADPWFFRAPGRRATVLSVLGYRTRTNTVLQEFVESRELMRAA